MASLYVRGLSLKCPLLLTKKQAVSTHFSTAGKLIFCSPDSLWTVELSYQASLPVLSVTLFGEIRIRSLIQCSAKLNEISFMVSRPLAKKQNPAFPIPRPEMGRQLKGSGGWYGSPGLGAPPRPDCHAFEPCQCWILMNLFCKT